MESIQRSIQYVQELDALIAKAAEGSKEKALL
jgi:hypothetical protein